MLDPKTNDNQVFYAQYAYARICSVLKKFDGKVEKLAKYDLLVSEKEIDLIKHLNEFVSVVKDTLSLEYLIRFVIIFKN